MISARAEIPIDARLAAMSMLPFEPTTAVRPEYSGPQTKMASASQPIVAAPIPATTSSPAFRVGSVLNVLDQEPSHRNEV